MPAWTKTHLLSRHDVAPVNSDYRVLGAFNPAAAAFGDRVALLVRVAQQPVAERERFTPLPRYDAGALVVDWLANEDLEFSDRRVYRLRNTRAARLTSVSHLQVAFADRDHRIQDLGPAVLPQGEYEEFGIEDPRITPLEGRYYITYVAVSRHGACTALMSTADFRTFDRHGIIFPCENKDVVLFPERIDGAYVALHRPVSAMPFTEPEIWIARSPDLRHWGDHRPLYRGQAPWETGRVGAGAPPLRTPRGWLEIYHANRRPEVAGDIGAYCGGAMLLDLNDPARIAQVAPQPLLEPNEPYEQQGFVPNVVFPGGIVHVDDRILVYYGAADESTAVAETAWHDLAGAFD
jgi:predicted GH43/DUF377 family glycosyl hydrolase